MGLAIGPPTFVAHVVESAAHARRPISKAQIATETSLASAEPPRSYGAFGTPASDIARRPRMRGGMVLLDATIVCPRLPGDDAPVENRDVVEPIAPPSARGGGSSMLTRNGDKDDRSGAWVLVGHGRTPDQTTPTAPGMCADLQLVRLCGRRGGHGFSGVEPASHGGRRDVRDPALCFHRPGRPGDGPKEESAREKTTMPAAFFLRPDPPRCPMGCSVTDRNPPVTGSAKKNVEVVCVGTRCQRPALQATSPAQ